MDKRPPGSGALDLFGFARGDLGGGTVGAGIRYEHRIDGSLSLWGQSEVGYGYGGRRDLVYEALAGLRWRW